MGAQEVAVVSTRLTEKRWLDYGFNDNGWEKYRLRDISQKEAEDKGFSNASDGIYIPYPRDGDSRVRWHRTGFAVQTAAGKYGQRAHTAPALYVPPTLPSKWSTKSDVPIMITEGEFKAMVVDHLVNGEADCKVFPVAVSGVFNWQQIKRGVDVIPDIKDIKWLGRTVYFAFDMDQNTNSMVSLALQKLVNKLGELGAQCLVLQWPAEWKGIDDYLSEQMLPTESWLEMCSSAQLPGHITSVIDMNERFSYCEIQQQVFDSQNSTYVTIKSFQSDFFTRTIKVQTGTKNNKPVFSEWNVGKYWLMSPFRNTVIEPIFKPGATRVVVDDDTRYLNTWAGWGVGLRSKSLEPVKGDVKPLYDFLYATFSTEDPKHVDYLIKRLAWMFQQPTQKHPTWIYMMGRPLQGKSALIKLIATLVGERYTANVDESIVRGQFAEWRNEKLLVTFDDSQITDPRVLKQLLKRLTTESSSQVNLKYVKAQTLESYFSFIFATNSVDPLLDHDDRRALVLEANCSWDFKKGEWNEFDEWRRSKSGVQALLYHFLYEVKLDAAFYTAVPPRTSARELVIEVSESTWDDIINTMLSCEEGITWLKPASGGFRKWKPTVFTLDMLKQVYLLRNNGEDKYKTANSTLVGKLTRYGARRCMPNGATDMRHRLSLEGQQVALWTWDWVWAKASREELAYEYRRLTVDIPELFPGTSKY